MTLATPYENNLKTLNPKINNRNKSQSSTVFVFSIRFYFSVCLDIQGAEFCTGANLVAQLTRDLEKGGVSLGYIWILSAPNVV